MAKKKVVKEKNSKRNEIAGVIFIALAVLCALAIYMNMDSAFGDGVKTVVFGLLGIAGYVFPVAAGVIGVLLIVARHKDADAGRVFLIVLLVILIVSLLHLTVIENLNTEDFGAYVQESFIVGMNDCAGGGFIGCLISYPLFLYLSIVGAYIVIIAGMAVVVIAFTNISIKKMGSDIGHAVKNTYDNYVEYREERRQIRQKKAQPLFIEDLNSTIESDNEEYSRNPYDIKIEAGRNSISVGKIYKEPVRKADVIEPVKEDKPELMETKYLGAFNKQNEEFVDETVDLYIEGRKASNEIRKIRQDIAEGNLDVSPAVEAKPAKSSSRRKVSDAVKPDIAVEGTAAATAATAAAAAFTSETDSDEKKTSSSAGGKKSEKYKYPPLSLLNDGQESASVSAKDKKQNAVLLEDTLANFNIPATVESISVGPVVTRYEVKPAAGIKVSRIVNLADDIALAFAVAGVRIEAPIPGKAAVGIEVPNESRSGVCLKELLSSAEYKKIKSTTVFALGKDIAGSNIYADIAKLPHLLIAGQTGAGKSVCENALIASILFNASPEEVKMIMIDPKVVELKVYNNIPHLLVPVVTDIKKAPATLQWAVNEMTMRYRLLAENGSREISGYNASLPEGREALPHLIIIIDEVAELMMASPKEVEDSICRIAQLGRAAGIHLVVATQRPSVNVITGVIKANIPSRIAFSVASQIDSRTILDQAGAEKLLGRGDMLFLPTGAPKPLRVQGCFVSDDEIKALCDFLRNNSEPMYDTKVEEDISGSNSSDEVSGGEDDETDPLFAQAVKLVVDTGSASISMLQRRFRVGYARAARLIDEMEIRGYVSGYEGSKPRQVLISNEQYNEIFGQDSVGD